MQCDSFAHLDAVPVLTGEGVDGLLLETLLALGQSLVPAAITVSIRNSWAGSLLNAREYSNSIEVMHSLANSHLCVRTWKDGGVLVVRGCRLLR